MKCQNIERLKLSVKAFLLSNYYSDITNEQIEAEVRNQWTLNGENNRRRISKKDKNSALANLRKKAYERVELLLADEFMVRFGSTQHY